MEGVGGLGLRTDGRELGGRAGRGLKRRFRAAAGRHVRRGRERGLRPAWGAATRCHANGGARLCLARPS